MTGPFLTPNAVAERLALDVDAVRGFIATGQLAAVNVGRGTRKPRWRIDPLDLDRFLETRRTAPTPKPSPRRRAVAAERVRYFEE